MTQIIFFYNLAFTLHNSLKKEIKNSIPYLPKVDHIGFIKDEKAENADLGKGEELV